ncbi:MEKHLA domain-containing protein [Haloferula helveola]|uniref:MEKHLA domain-containing protein n=1 Tax=Haloferula helveola TaxID=490095 RepID=A0ABN6H2I9_9BACT|nr:MEKHLA domain-containing protein [Haloferula helveola]
MTSPNPEPSEENDFLAAHVALLESSFRRLTGRDLIPGGVTDATTLARQLYQAPFFLASHDGGDDPVFNYANLTAQALFELDWSTFMTTPSRFTAEEPNRAERARLLERVTAEGFIDDYAGIRISRTGKRFRIEGATVWNVSDDTGKVIGQAATFDRWVSIQHPFRRAEQRPIRRR